MDFEGDENGGAPDHQHHREWHENRAIAHDRPWVRLTIGSAGFGSSAY
jgi:hypothetical protein